MQMQAPAYFPQTYRQARERFLATAAARRLSVDSCVHPFLAGIDGEELAQDVALLGDPAAAAMLILTSATHGIEGYCGSGCQTALLHDPAFHAAVTATGVAVLLVHAVNPHGFSHGSRVNEDNVDLNRNFLDHAGTYPANVGYAELHDLLLPDVWPPTPENQAAIDAWIDGHGAKAFQAAVSGGQYTHPDGMFFGGHRPTWSNRSLREVLASYGAGRRRIAWIDFHTGLGPCGHGEKIFADVDDTDHLACAKAWWGEGVTSIYDGSSSSALLSGLMWTSIYDTCPAAEYTGIALEYGTVAFPEVSHALRGDHWLRLHPQADPALRRSIKATMRGAFYIETDVWKQQVYDQALLAVRQSLSGMSERR